MIGKLKSRMPLNLGFDSKSSRNHVPTFIAIHLKGCNNLFNHLVAFAATPLFLDSDSTAFSVSDSNLFSVSLSFCKFSASF